MHDQNQLCSDTNHIYIYVLTFFQLISNTAHYVAIVCDNVLASTTGRTLPLMTNWYSYFKTHWWGLVVALYSLIRLVPIMLLKLPIVLWSNAPEFCLLCSKYAPHVKHYALQIQHLFILCYINYKIMSINSLSSCQHTIKSLPMYVHKHYIWIHFCSICNFSSIYNLTKSL